MDLTELNPSGDGVHRLGGAIIVWLYHNHLIGTCVSYELRVGESREVNVKLLGIKPLLIGGVVVNLVNDILSG